MSPERESGRAQVSFYASMIAARTGEPKNISDLYVFRLFIGFWSHFNIVYLLNLLFNILRTGPSEQYK